MFMRYAIVIPAKNEEKNLEQLLVSIASQTIKPVVCLLLDDESEDKTKAVFDSFKEKFDFFDYYKTKGSIKYQVGAHIANLFNKGVQILKDRKYSFDYVVKMDADIAIEKDLFEKLSNKIKGVKYGVFSPGYFMIENGERKNIFSPEWHSNGQLKVYHIVCFDEIGGLIPNFGWDCADNILAVEKGWKTAAFRDVFFEMKRPIGRYSLYEARRRQGIGAFVLGYHPFYLVIKGVYGMLEKPFIAGSFVYWFYFIKTSLSSQKRILNKNQVRILRKLFWQSLFSRFRKKEFSLLQKEKS
jgi:glycosyltransferase involved in cell wall biosynthesis